LWANVDHTLVSVCGEARRAGGDWFAALAQSEAPCERQMWMPPAGFNRSEGIVDTIVQ